MEKLITNASDSDALTCIAERLGTTDEQNIIVRVVSHRWLERWLERLTEILTEIHSEISQVFHHDGVVFRCQTSDGAQFLLAQTNPCGIVWIAIKDGANVSLGKIAFEFRTQFLTTEIIHIEGLIFHTLHLQLHLLNRETRVDEEHGVLVLVSLGTSEERSEGTLHTSTHRHTTFGLNIHVDECLHKTGRLFLQFGIALDVGITVGYSVLQGFYLCIHSHLSSRKSWNTHFHFDKLHTRLLFSHCRHLLHFTDGCFGKVLYAETVD